MTCLSVFVLQESFWNQCNKYFKTKPAPEDVEDVGFFEHLARECVQSFLQMVNNSP